jgi:hypothetical protein
VDPERNQFRKEDGLVLRLLEALSAGECRAPIDRTILEALATGTLGAPESELARNHLAECVYCLHAFSEIQSLLEMPTPAEVREEEARVQAAHSTRSELENRVRELIGAIERERRLLAHRARQLEYSDPGLHASADAALDQTWESPLEEDVEALVSRLETARRSMEEQQNLVTMCLGLLKQHGQLAAQVRAAGMSRDWKLLDRARGDLIDLLQQLSRRLRV